MEAISETVMYDHSVIVQQSFIFTVMVSLDFINFWLRMSSCKCSRWFLLSCFLLFLDRWESFCKNKFCFMSNYFYLNIILLLMMKINVKQSLFHSWRSDGWPTSTGKYVIIDWLIVWRFTPYRQYVSHTLEGNTLAVNPIILQIIITIYFCVTGNLNFNLLIIKVNFIRRLYNVCCCIFQISRARKVSFKIIKLSKGLKKTTLYVNLGCG